MFYACQRLMINCGFDTFACHANEIRTNNVLPSTSRITEFFKTKLYYVLHCADLSFRRTNLFS